MKLPVALALARAAGVRLEWLATGEGPMFPSEAGIMEAGDELAGDDVPPETPARRPISAAPGGMADQRPSSQEGALGIAWQVNPERLARAYAEASESLTGASATPTLIMRVALVLYDHLTETEAPAEASLPPRPRGN